MFVVNKLFTKKAFRFQCVQIYVSIFYMYIFLLTLHGKIVPLIYPWKDSSVQEGRRI